MNNSSKWLVIIVAGATTVAATLGVTLGAMQSRSPEVASKESIASNSSQTIESNPTLPQTAPPVVNSIAIDTKPQPETATAKTFQRELCTRANMAIVSDPNPPLNVRSSPRVTSNNIVGQLANGTSVTIVGDRNGWLQISRPIRGWVAKNRTRSSCTQMRTRITFPSGGNSTTVSDRIVGGGEHQYFLRLPRGQRMTVTSTEGPFPTIIAPNGRILAGDPYTDADRNQWSGRLPTSGDYTLQLESNGEGFEYSFFLQVR